LLYALMRLLYYLVLPSVGAGLVLGRVIIGFALFLVVFTLTRSKLSDKLLAITVPVAIMIPEIVWVFVTGGDW
jgi:hypothetical protein